MTTQNEAISQSRKRPSIAYVIGILFAMMTGFMLGILFTFIIASLIWVVLPTVF